MWPCWAQKEVLRHHRCLHKHSKEHISEQTGQPSPDGGKHFKFPGPSENSELVSHPDQRGNLQCARGDCVRYISATRGGCDVRKHTFVAHITVALPSPSPCLSLHPGQLNYHRCERRSVLHLILLDLLSKGTGEQRRRNGRTNFAAPID